MGWHVKVPCTLHQHRACLYKIPLGIFTSAMSFEFSEEICSVRDHSKGSKNKENKSCAVGLDLQLDVAPQL